MLCRTREAGLALVWIVPASAGRLMNLTPKTSDEYQ